MLNVTNLLKKTNHDIILRTDWKPIKDSDYIINSAGQIMNKFGRIIKGSINPYGYNVIGLKINGKQIMCQVHRLVAYYFVNNPDPENLQLLIIKMKIKLIMLLKILNGVHSLIIMITVML